MATDAPESTAWRQLRDALPGARARVESLLRRADADDGGDLAELTLAELSTALEELSVALVALDEQHAIVLELQGMVDSAARRGREVFDAMPDAVVVTDGRGLVREANVAAMRLLRQTAEFLRGKPLAAFVAEGRRTDFYGLLEGVAAGDGRAAGALPFRTDPDRAHTVDVAHSTLAGETVLYWIVADAPPAPVGGSVDPLPPPAAGARPASLADELESAKALAAQLQHALDSRVVIEQAKGRLAERLGVSETDAFEILRRHARGTGAKLADAAQAVVSGELDLS